MGIEWNTFKFMLACREAGIKFDNTMTLGRQELHIAPTLAEQLLRDAGLPMSNHLVSEIASGNRYADKFLNMLGSKNIQSVDGSDFEGATIVHDMNQPLPETHYGKYDFVFDGGTLEHVFHFPTALKSAMQAVKVGGHLLLHTPTNNYCGHGFYQLSPELFFRALSPQNGFKMKRMIAFEAMPGATWYEVSDPEAVHHRVEVAYARQRILLLVLAERTYEAEIFSTTPQQSDYASRWQDHAQGTPRVGYKLPLIARTKNAFANLLRSNPSVHIAASRIYSSLKSRDRKLSIRTQPGFFQANSTGKL